MHPTRIRDLPLDHVRAVRCDDAAQLGPGKISAMLGQKPRGAEPAATITAVAGDGIMWRTRAAIWAKGMEPVN
jgi:hypothetical protein